jgi:hypothetical protein
MKPRVASKRWPLIRTKMPKVDDSLEMPMKRCLSIFLMVIMMLPLRPALSQAGTDAPDLSTVLSLFSAHAGAEGIRVNWTLDQQSPAIFGFRIYRGYAAAGHFAVLTEMEPRSANGVMSYTHTDTSAIPGVTYYYKLTAIGQAAESVFPVVISAAVTPHPTGSPVDMSAPVTLLPGERIELYVRKQGRVQLDVIEPVQRALVNDILAPGIYEFDSMQTGESSRLRLIHEDGYQADINWPIK